MLDEKHLEYFGAIVTAYAAVELEIKITISAIIEEDLAVTSVLSEPYSVVNLCNVASSLAILKLDDTKVNKISELNSKFKEFSSLRNAVAHDFWVTGTREKSIRPSGLKINSGKPKTKGFQDDEPDYSYEDLENAAVKLINLREEYKKFHKEYGLYEIIEKLNKFPDTTATNA